MVELYPHPSGRANPTQTTESSTMKKQKRLEDTGKPQSALGRPEETPQAAIFKNSLRSWQARWQARKATDAAAPTEQPEEPKAEQ